MLNPSPIQQQNSVSPQFVAAMEAIKALHVMVVSVMTDLSALRRTVLEDQEFQNAYKKHLTQASMTARPILAEAMEDYERMISGGGAATTFEN